MLSVCHVSPTYFAPESLLGGGERFAEELARAMAAEARVRFVSFGPRAFSERRSEGCERVVLRGWFHDPMLPFSPRLRAAIRGFDVIHCHQENVLSTFLAAWWGARQGSRVFVSDLGGGGWTPGYQIDLSRWVSERLPISAYAARPLAARGLRHTVIHGGVDLARYPPRPRPEHDGSLVFLGRLLPHKGVHFLLRAVGPTEVVHLIGREGDAAYVDELRRLAAGKAVHFHRNLGDAEVRALLGRAMALVHPTPVDEHGSAGAHELFGLALVEAMACGCPVVASNVASLPEIVRHEAEGLLVRPNEPAAIAAALGRLRREGELWQRLSVAARQRVAGHFTWRQVAARCLARYAAALAPPVESETAA